MTTGLAFDGAFCDGTELQPWITARMPGKQYAKALDIAMGQSITTDTLPFGLSCSGYDAGYT